MCGLFHPSVKMPVRALHSPTAHTTHYLPQKAACRTQYCCYAAPSAVPSARLSATHADTGKIYVEYGPRRAQRSASTAAR